MTDPDPEAQNQTDLDPDLEHTETGKFKGQFHYLMMYSNVVVSGPVSLISQPFRLTQAPQSFDGRSFGGGMLVGLTYIFIPIGFAMELIEDREVGAHRNREFRRVRS
jgi:hypothetical protein